MTTTRTTTSPKKQGIARMTRYGHNWTVLTFAKVLRGPFTSIDIHYMNPEKYPKDCRRIRDTLNALVKMGLLDSLGQGVYKINEVGVATVFWYGNYFANTRTRSKN